MASTPWLHGGEAAVRGPIPDGGQSPPVPLIVPPHRCVQFSKAVFKGMQSASRCGSPSVGYAP